MPYTLSAYAEGKFQELTSSNCSVRAIEAVRNIVEKGTDFDCYKLNAFRMADDIGISKADVLQTFIFATKLGIFDLNWDIHCPTCSGIPEYHKHLMGLKNTAHCDFCRIDWSLDFEEQIEVTFTVNPNIRPIVYEDFRERDFAGKMDFFYDVLSREGRSFIVPKGKMSFDSCIMPQGRKTYEAEFSCGEYIYYMPPYMEGGGTLIVSGEISDAVQTVDLMISSEGRLDIQRLSFQPGKIQFHVTSQLPYPNVFLVKSNAPKSHWVSASYVTSQQYFRDLFEGEFLSPDTSFAVRNMTLLFTDIKGSTELYERLGDSKAYTVVQEHFRRMINIIKKYEGGVIKTIGDAVMAAFPINANAVEAACRIHQAFHIDPVHGVDVQVKIGIHKGQLIAVTSNKNLDYFGRTVNIAARIQGKSTEYEVLMSEEVLSDPAVERFLCQEGLETISRITELKGVSEQFEVFSVMPSMKR